MNLQILYKMSVSSEVVQWIHAQMVVGLSKSLLKQFLLLFHVDDVLLSCILQRITVTKLCTFQRSITIQHSVTLY
jgi:hypothetical protein